jgi:hypothetical protein
MTSPLTTQQLDEIQVRANAATSGPWTVSEDYADILDFEGHHLASFWGQPVGEFIAHAREDVPSLLAEVRRLKDEQTAARPRVLAEAADIVDAMLTAEPDHTRASALYEALLKLRAKLPCTCARSQGLHEKCCRKYTPGHDLLSPVRALAAYRAERAVAVSSVV